MTQVEPVLVLDCLGMKCPRPIIELASRMPDVPVGGLVEVLSDDPAAGADLAAWSRMRGHSLVTSAAPSFVLRRNS